MKEAIIDKERKPRIYWEKELPNLNQIRLEPFRPNPKRVIKTPLKTKQYKGDGFQKVRNPILGFSLRKFRDDIDESARREVEETLSANGDFDDECFLHIKNYRVKIDPPIRAYRTESIFIDCYEVDYFVTGKYDAYRLV